MSGRAAIDVRCLAEDLEPFVDPTRLEIGRAQAEIHLGPLLARLHHGFEFLDGVVGPTEIEQRQPEVVVRLRRRRVDLQSLGQYLERAREILQLPLHLAEQRQELGVAGELRERGVELLACAFEPAEIDIDVGQVEAGGHERGIEGQRLAELGDGFPHDVRGPAVRYAMPRSRCPSAEPGSRARMSLRARMASSVRPLPEKSSALMRLSFSCVCGLGCVRLKGRQERCRRDGGASNDDNEKNTREV